jgi:murein DD-endopeptidase MepM/ murein hydrolase activator NlpD
MSKFAFCVLSAFLLLGVILTSCSKVASETVENKDPIETSRPNADLPVAISTPRVMPTLFPSRTPILDLQSESQPLAIEFPTPAQVPISDWRSPLYQIPWALGPLDHFYFTRPIQADEINWPLPDYRYGYVFPETNQVHTGVDIDAPYGTPVYAAASGTVTFAGYGLMSNSSNKKDPYGLAVAVRHDFGWGGRRLTTIYAHMSEIAVRPGMYVNQGDIIGYIGQTGNTTGPHLHFEIRLEKSDFFASRNPELWLVPPEGNGLLVARIMNSNGSLIDRQIMAVTNRKGHTWDVYTYAPIGVNSDDKYRENLVLSDLPAGDYRIYIKYQDEPYNFWFTVHPGSVSYITFRGTLGFHVDTPPTPDPGDWLVTPIPGNP